MKESSIAYSLFSSPTLYPFRNSKPLVFEIFLQTLISFHSYTNKTFWWKVRWCSIFSILPPLIPFEAPIPLCFGFFLQTLISLHSYIKKKLLDGRLDCALSCLKEKSNTHISTQSYQLPKPPHHKNGAWNLCLIDLLPLVIYNDDVESGVFTLWLLMDEMVLRFQY